MATTAAPTVTSASGIDTISSTTGVDTIAKFIYATDLSINSVYLPFERDQTTDTPYSLFKTIDKDGSVTNYHGTFVRETVTSPIAAGSKITSFEGTNAAGIEQFSFTTSKGYDGLKLKEAVKANDKATFFNIVLGGNDSIIGSSQDDVLGGYLGNDTIDGSLGNDKVFFSGDFTDYQITPASKTNSFVTVKNTKTGETDSLTNVESLQFSDKTIPTPTSSIAPTPLPVTSKSATLNLFTNALNMSQADLSNDNVIPSATQIKMVGGDGGFSIFDGQFTYDASGLPTSTSTVSAVHDYLPPNGAVKNFDLVLGANNNAPKIAQYFDKLDGQGLFNYIFAGDDVINGSTGNDTLSGYAGNDIINGGAGKDTVFFSGNYADYKITPQPGTGLSADTFVTVQNTKTGEIDSLMNIESLQFLDKTIATPTTTPVVTLPKVTVSAKQSSVIEGENLVYTVSLDKAATTDLTIPYTLSGTGITTADFTGLTSLTTGNVTIKAGQTSASVSLTTKVDTLSEVSEGVILTLGTVAGVTATMPLATATISDKVIAPTVGNNITITAPDASVSNTSKINATNVTTAGDDKITSTVANLANATIDGGVGNDTLTLSDATSDATARLMITSTITPPELSTSGFTVLNNVETLHISNTGGSLLIDGRSSIKTVIGGSGNDIVTDGVERSSIDGGAGNDIIMPGSNSTVSGGVGNDIFSYPRVSPTNMLANWNGTITDFASNTDKFDFSNNQIPVSTTTSPSSSSSIIGAWKATTSFGDAIATFMSDGTYFYADPNGGAEKGTYSWDSAKSTFSVTGNTFDTSQLGFNPSSTPTAVTFNGTSASWTVQGVKITANPIIDATKQIVGSWNYKAGQGVAENDGMVTFLPNGTYVLVEQGTGQGAEIGTYSWDSATKNFSVKGISIDTNGDGGFSSLNATSALTATVAGNSLSVASSDGTFIAIKVVSPTTTAPTTSTSMVNAPVSFLGNKADFAQVQKAIVANASNLQVVYQQDKNILWADVNNDGALNASDLQITLNGVKTLANADFA